jgi:hypothetical protein
LLLFGYTPDKVKSDDQPQAYLDDDIFTDCFRDTLIPEIQARCVKDNYHGPAFLVMDNCTAHADDEFRQIYQGKNRISVFLPRHSSNQLQTLDSSIFSITQSCIARWNKLEEVYTNHSYSPRVLLCDNTWKHRGELLKGSISVTKQAETREIVCAAITQTARCLIHPMNLAEHRTEVDWAVVEEASVEGADERDPNQEE